MYTNVFKSYILALDFHDYNISINNYYQGLERLLSG